MLPTATAGKHCRFSRRTVIEQSRTPRPSHRFWNPGHKKVPAKAFGKQAWSLQKLWSDIFSHTVQILWFHNIPLLAFFCFHKDFIALFKGFFWWMLLFLIVTLLEKLTFSWNGGTGTLAWRRHSSLMARRPLFESSSTEISDVHPPKNTCSWRMGSGSRD